MKISGRDIKATIMDGLGLQEPIAEATVATPKQFDLPTERLGKKGKDAHERLYKAYVDKLNRISAQLDTIDRDAAAPSSAYRALKESETLNRNAVHLHELFFSNISDVQSEVTYDSLSYMRLARDFGTFEDWQWDFMACARAAAAGGWAVTAFDCFRKRFVNFFISGHDACIPVGCYPVIVLDMWEHARWVDYLDDVDTYIAAMMGEFRWDVIERRIERADAMARIVG